MASATTWDAHAPAQDYVIHGQAEQNSRPPSRQPPSSHCIPPTTPSIMSSLRIARAALRARPAAISRPLQRRGYADVASDKIKLSLALPHSVRTDCPFWSHMQRHGSHIQMLELTLTNLMHSPFTSRKKCMSPLLRPSATHANGFRRTKLIDHPQRPS